MMDTTVFDLDAGALCLDFANSVEWHDSDHPDDKLHDFTDLVAWGQAAGVLTAEQAQELRQLDEQRPQKTRKAFGKALKCREAIYRLFSDYAAQTPVKEVDLSLLNEALSETMSQRQLVVGDETPFSWVWKQNLDNVDLPYWAVSQSAAELLTSEQLERVRKCADDRGCGYLFLDTSRNGRRRWCSMESCGNRAKARRHYNQHRK